MAECSAEPTLTVAALHAVLQAEIEAGRGGNKLLVEGPLTLFEVSDVHVEPQNGRVWLETSWCRTQEKVKS